MWCFKLFLCGLRCWCHSSCSGYRCDLVKWMSVFLSSILLRSACSALWLMAPAHHNAICWNLHTNDPSRLSIHPSSSQHTPWRLLDTHTHILIPLSSPSPSHCHYKSQQLLHALIINHNCLSIFPHLFNVAVRGSRGGGEQKRTKKVYWDTEREMDKF